MENGAKALVFEGFQFDSGLVIRGLVIDSKLGNIVKVDRYGYVRKALCITYTLRHYKPIIQYSIK